MTVEKLYQDKNLVFVNKPYDMYINSDDINEQNTVAYHIASPDSHLSSSSNPLHFVHRLDYSTSGVLCICLNKVVAAEAGRLFEKRLAKKYYLAIVRGWMKDACEVRYKIAEDPSSLNSNHKMLSISSNETQHLDLKSRVASTRVLPIKHGYYRGEECSVALIKPETGRRHQIRVHLSSIDHTILGDYTYSDRTDTVPHRMFLHAVRLVLPFKNNCLDVSTEDVFFNDPELLQHWKTIEIVYPYENKCDLIKICEIVDSCEVNKHYF